MKICDTKIRPTILLSVIFLNACTIAQPFKGPGYKDGKVVIQTDNNQVVVGLTYIHVGDNRQKNKVFWDYVMRVSSSMENHSGLIGYAIRRELFGKKGWTMSVWENEDSLNKFVQSEIHQEAIKNGIGALKDTRFARFTRDKNDIPLKWEEVVQILEETPASQHHY